MDLFSPHTAYAASESLNTFIGHVDDQIINPLIKLLFALAIVFFLYGVVQFVANGDNEEKKTEGRSHMLWGIIGLTIMMGVFGILTIILKTFNINGIDPANGTVQLNDYSPTYPQIK